MLTRFDHAILAVGSLQGAVDDLHDLLGFDVQFGGKHSNLGTENGIVRFGLDYLEVLGVADREEVIQAGVKRMSLLDYIDNNGGGWLAFCMATDNIKGLAQHFNNIGLRSLGPYDMERVRPDGTVLKWQLLVPEHSAWRKPWPFFIQWALPDDERLTVETPGKHRLCKECHVQGVDLVVRDLDAAKYLYIQQLGFEDKGPGFHVFPETEVAVVGLDQFTVRLVSPTGPGPVMNELELRGEGLVEVLLQTPNMEGVSGQIDSKLIVNTRGDRIIVNLLPGGSEMRRAFLSIGT